MIESKAAHALDRLLEIMATLRSPEGCPWDAAQTPESLKRYLVEETYEVLDALDTGDADAIRDELGDLLLQIVFQARIFEERGEFDLGDVALAIADKLERRHPHVFGNVAERSIAALNAQWEKIKAVEKREKGKSECPFDDLPAALPALVRARKILEKSARTGDEAPASDHNMERLRQDFLDFQNALQGEQSREAGENLGRLLFSLVRVASEAHIDAEESLRQTLKTILVAHNRP